MPLSPYLSTPSLLDIQANYVYHYSLALPPLLPDSSGAEFHRSSIRAVSDWVWCWRLCVFSRDGEIFKDV